jgi:hypothetical protein
LKDQLLVHAAENMSVESKIEIRNSRYERLEFGERLATGSTETAEKIRGILLCDLRALGGGSFLSHYAGQADEANRSLGQKGLDRHYLYM